MTIIVYGTPSPHPTPAGPIQGVLLKVSTSLK